MKGLDFEFERFWTICCEGASAEEMAGTKRIFLAGALAQASRMLAFLDSELPIKRKMALLRRVARECESFQNEIIKAARVEHEP